MFSLQYVHNSHDQTIQTVKLSKSYNFIDNFSLLSKHFYFLRSISNAFIIARKKVKVNLWKMTFDMRKLLPPHQFWSRTPFLSPFTACQGKSRLIANRIDYETRAYKRNTLHKKSRVMQQMKKYLLTRVNFQLIATNISENYFGAWSIVRLSHWR
jgi:hypothetical protein